MAQQEMPIFTRTFDFLTWLLPATNKFPRAHRHTFTQRLLNAAFDLREHLEEANLRRGRERAQKLQNADEALARVRGRPIIRVSPLQAIFSTFGFGIFAARLLILVTILFVAFYREAVKQDNPGFPAVGGTLGYNLKTIPTLKGLYKPLLMVRELLSAHLDCHLGESQKHFVSFAEYCLTRVARKLL